MANLCDGKREYRNIASTLWTAQYLDGPTGEEIREPEPRATKPIEPTGPAPLTDDQRQWLFANLPKRGQATIAAKCPVNGSSQGS